MKKKLLLKETRRLRDKIREKMPEEYNLLNSIISTIEKI